MDGCEPIDQITNCKGQIDICHTVALKKREDRGRRVEEGDLLHLTGYPSVEGAIL